MNLRKTLLAASIVAALPMMASNAAQAAAQLMSAPVAQASPQESAGLVSKLSALDNQRGLSADHSFRIASQHPGVVGEKITRANHTFKGLRVFGSESVVVTNSAGDIVSESVSDRRTALSAPAASGGGRSATVAPADWTPTLSASDAIALVVKAVAPSGTHRWAPNAELLIYPVMKSVRVASALNKSESALNAMDLEEVVDHYELAYFVQTRMANKGKPVYFDTMVNAKTGAVIAQWKALQTVVGTGNSQYNGQVPIQTSLSGSTYQMLDSTRGTGGTYGGMAITNANHSSANSPDAGSIYTSTSNVWGDGQNYNGGSTTSANGQTAAVNALWGLMNTYDALKNVLGWQSLDGNNTATYIAAHVDTAYDNAFYDDGCKCMYIGDGSSFYSLGSIDVIGHEMSHGVTAATSNLNYSGESGGLNESNSDIGGEMVEAYARAGGTGSVIPATGNDWMMGKEISKSGQPLRWMYKPSKDGGSPDAWSSTIKNLDVHYSSGPNNRMFYFLSQGSNASSSSDYYSKYLVKSPAAMTGIGNDKAFRIWFKALTTKFTSSTNYADARTKVLAAATELYGAGSKEVIAVTRAYAAINVGADIDETGGTGGVSITTQPSNVSVTAGSTASFSVGAAGGTSPYTYKWYRNGAVITGATSATYSLTAQTADNGAVFNAVVSDSSSPVKTATSGNATLTVGTTGGTTERVTNGGFESGATGWAGTTGVIGNYSGQTAYEGTKFAWLGGNGTTASETITQAVTIPSTVTSATLTFALHIDTAETGSTVYDKLVVTVKNSAGSVLGTLASYSNVNAASGYQVRTFNMSAYKGQTVTLSFAMTEDSSLQTSFVVDKVSLITQ
ncbi:M4 family metallopeptidase [Duganella violaceipulchra]|uniref:M4 family metallopeptidase n=1 Tax=Duganella violaceipulchra TaxID=2849652 RepID=A0AA41H557_9BURK|nr:M4 family metallopeptidase [Duganella violaceicalia]MBV6320204.1 M4 family metallopeptidase [Duganella violaceicalia]MCP2011652.1 Zn-dependent metalloprotease [Duganella violaceicalia]